MRAEYEEAAASGEERAARQSGGGAAGGAGGGGGWWSSVLFRHQCGSVLTTSLLWRLRTGPPRPVSGAIVLLYHNRIGYWLHRQYIAIQYMGIGVY